MVDLRIFFGNNLITFFFFFFWRLWDLKESGLYAILWCLFLRSFG